MEPHTTDEALRARGKSPQKIDPVFDPTKMTGAERVAAAKALLEAARRSESAAIAGSAPAEPRPAESALQAEVASLRETVDTQQRKLDALLECLTSLGAASEVAEPEVAQPKPRHLHIVRPDTLAG